MAPEDYAETTGRQSTNTPRQRFSHYLIMKSSSPHCQEVKVLQHWIYLMLTYLQLELEEESQELVTINTHKSLYKYTRLQFGVASAPAIFQRTMEAMLQGLPMVCVYLDDILVSGKMEQECLANLHEVLTHLESERNAHFVSPKLHTYLGHIISAGGLKPSPNKVRAVSDLPSPLKVSELKTFLDLVNYYAKFLPDLATRLAQPPYTNY